MNEDPEQQQQSRERRESSSDQSTLILQCTAIRACVLHPRDRSIVWVYGSNVYLVFSKFPHVRRRLAKAVEHKARRTICFHVILLSVGLFIAFFGHH